MDTFTITDNAAHRLQDLLDTGLEPPQHLRIAIKGGGCAGFSYDFAIEQTPEEGDFRFQKDDVAVVIDPVSAGYLQGATLDYVREMLGERFVLSNPNAKSTCGCGSSFAG